jgi:cytidyltransferase-like protein
MDDIIYVDMVGDLFHCGHVAYLKECKRLGKILKVGIHGDDDVRSYKRQPILTMEERIKVVEACKYVDEVIPNAPLKLTKDFLKLHNIHRVCHADDISDKGINDMYSDVIDVLFFIPYTRGISTTLIIERIKNRT